MKSLPSISIITNCYNPDLSIFALSLNSIRGQNYPKRLIEHIVMDAGSTNGAVELAKKYKCKIIKRPDLLYNSQERMSLGIKKAKGELVFIFETDNILMGHNNLHELVQPIVEHKEIWCTFSFKNGYYADMPALTRYFALFGTNDCYLYYLKKTEKVPHDISRYDKGTILGEYTSYYVIQFQKSNFPPMGDNGFLARRTILNKVNQDQQAFIHVDAFYSLLLKGYDTYGVVKNQIIHYSGTDILNQYKSRLNFKDMFYDKRRNERVYLTFNPRSYSDVLNTFKFLLVSFTVVIPLVRSIRGYLKVPDVAWFLHPMVCMVAATMYTKSEISYILRTYFLPFHEPIQKT